MLVRCTRALTDMPKWEQDEDSGQKDLMFLGDVKQKVAKIKSRMPRTHQLFLHVGARQQSAPRVVRSCGAVGSSPFAQIFKGTIDERPSYVFSPALIFVIGNAKCCKAHIHS